MLYIVDGTGPADDTEYRQAMGNGHCSRLERRFRSFARYFRGPPLGGGTNIAPKVLRQMKLAALQAEAMGQPGMGLTLAVAGYSESNTNQRGKVLSAIAKDPGKIYLCGYSRGGATVVSVAHALAKQNRAVEAMFLFDPVDSDSSLEDTETIPPNVKQPFMAFRNMDHVRSLGLAAEREWRKVPISVIEAMIAMARLNVIPGVPSFLPIKPASAAEAAKSLVNAGRQPAEAVAASWRAFDWRHLVARDAMFETCVTGLSAADGRQVFKPQRFDGTHGAMGGCPWPPEAYPKGTNYEAVDDECSAKTWAWLFACIAQTNLKQDAVERR